MITRRKFAAAAASVFAGAAAAFGISRRKVEYQYKYQKLEGMPFPGADRQGKLFCDSCQTYVRTHRKHLLFTYDENGLEKTEFANLHCIPCGEKLLEMEIVMCTNWDRESPEDRAHNRLLHSAWATKQGG